MTLDGHGKLLYSNSRFAKMVGYRDSEIKGKTLLDLLPFPLGVMHVSGWLRRKEQAEDRAPCLNGRTITLANRLGKPVYVCLERMVRLFRGFG